MHQQRGFTLVELAIVLVIIGLVVGGVLVGRDLIAAASVNAQLTQISKYNAAFNTFQIKYQSLPGDIRSSKATEFGFAARGTSKGQGDGNGTFVGSNANCCDESTGELVMFWVDLGAAGLISEKLTTATSATTPSADITGASVGDYLPKAKIGQSNYVYVWAGGSYAPTWIPSYAIYYGISAVNTIAAVSNSGGPTSSKGLTVAQAYNMDQKIDDALPEYGKVLSLYLNTARAYWADGTNSAAVIPPQSPDTTSITPSMASCYDNGGVAAATKIYSMSVNGGDGVNCVLSFRFI